MAQTFIVIETLNKGKKLLKSNKLMLSFEENTNYQGYCKDMIQGSNETKPFK